MELSVLFVCLGNICRSPSGEAVLKAKLKENELGDVVFVDSAGTSGYHEGELADQRMQSHAIKRGFDLTSLSRQVIASDFDKFDYIIAMDRSNYKNLQNMVCSDEHKKKIFLMTDFSNQYNGDVSDPYYGGTQGFEDVLDIIEDSVDGLIENNLKLKTKNQDFPTFSF
jgi:protein-tyrosine phosphatase